MYGAALSAVAKAIVGEAVWVQLFLPVTTDTGKSLKINAYNANIIASARNPIGLTHPPPSMHLCA